MLVNLSYIYIYSILHLLHKYKVDSHWLPGIAFFQQETKLNLRENKLHKLGMGNWSVKTSAEMPAFHPGVPELDSWLLANADLQRLWEMAQEVASLPSTLEAWVEFRLPALAWPSTSSCVGSSCPHICLKFKLNYFRLSRKHR